eukprot:TRINITY_DN9553_c0_g1_i1.p1 TRINITY_DN9553_c0_g1~~TRINITY_DN9553_c0_g1_i1.p1  ORF type:complete len:541 (-),score=125.98 TRINITY_DN9553_c0_g1_i1:74-1696(-)
MSAEQLRAGEYRANEQCEEGLAMARRKRTREEMLSDDTAFDAAPVVEVAEAFATPTLGFCDDSGMLTDFASAATFGAPGVGMAMPERSITQSPQLATWSQATQGNVDAIVITTARALSSLDNFVQVLAPEDERRPQLQACTGTVNKFLGTLFGQYPHPLPRMRICCSSFQLPSATLPEQYTPTPFDGKSQMALTDFDLKNPIEALVDTSENLVADGSEMWQVLHRPTGRFMCMRILPCTSWTQLGNSASVRAQHWAEAQLQSPFIAKLYSTFEDGTHMYIITEFVLGVSMYTAMSQGVFANNENKVKVTLGEVVLGLECLHKRDMVYCDLVPENIFIDAQGHVKLMHSPLLKYFTRCVEHKVYGRYAEYMPPELLQLARKAGKMCDFWCLGVLLYEMLSGMTPFAANEPTYVFAKVLAGDVNPPPLSLASPAARDLIRRLLVVDQDRRLGAVGGWAAVRGHAFFGGIDWAALSTGHAMIPGVLSQTWQESNGSRVQMPVPQPREGTPSHTPSPTAGTSPAPPPPLSIDLALYTQLQQPLL